MEIFLTILAGLAGMVVPIAIVASIIWVLDRRDQAKHDRAMAALDEGMIAVLRDMNQVIERRLAPYGNQAEEDYVARRLIAEATATMPISLLEEWVEQ